MTFVSPKHRREKIHKHGHMHLDDFVARRNEFQNELVIAGHFSVRYNQQQVLRDRKENPRSMGRAAQALAVSEFGLALRWFV
ncbi:MAG: hypothetical protein R3C56_09725 [Pirellulaceae bacterium]